MNKEAFLFRLKDLQIRHRSEYTPSEVRFLVKDILEEMHPTEVEWGKAVQEASTAQFFPKVADLIRITRSILSSTPGRGIVKVPCSTCDGEGLLWIRKDHPVILEEMKNSKSSRHFGVCGCGCPNTPTWHKETRFQDGSPKKPVATMTMLLHSDKRFRRSDFVKRNGQGVEESDEEYRERSLADAARIEKEGGIHSKYALDKIVSLVSESMKVPEKKEVPF